MVRLALALLLLAWMQAGGAAVRLDAHADRKELVLGEALTLEIRVQGRQEVQSLDALKLDALQADYDVRGVSRSRQSTTRKGREETADVVTVTLYPLRAGANGPEATSGWISPTCRFPWTPRATKAAPCVATKPAPANGRGCASNCGNKRNRAASTRNASTVPHRKSWNWSPTSLRRCKRNW